MLAMKEGKKEKKRKERKEKKRNGLLLEKGL